MKSILFFDSMLTPKVITVGYWVLLFCVILASLGTALRVNLGYGILGIFAGPIFIRIFCELLIIQFKINDNIRLLNESLKSKLHE